MKGCKGFFNAGHANRREFMQVGFAAGLGLSLPELLKTEAQGAAIATTSDGTAVYYYGLAISKAAKEISNLDTWPCLAPNDWAISS